MISAIVLASETRVGADLAHARETIVRSLVWLVSAVVSGVVRDVTLATPAGLGLSDVADHAGCDLVQADSECERLGTALARSRGALVLVLRGGYQPEAGLVDEIDAFVRRARPDAAALVLASPASALQRLLPDLAPVIGILAPRDQLTETSIASFHRLSRHFRRGTRFRARGIKIA